MAVIRKAGWELDEETGRQIFRVVVVYRDGDKLPDWTIEAVWKEMPVEIHLSDT